MKKVILIAFYFNQVNEIASKRIVPDLGFIPKENNDLSCRIIYTEYEDMFSHFSNKFKKSKSTDSNGSNVFNDSKDTIEFNDDKLKDSTSYSNPIISKAISMAGEVFAYPDGMKYWYESAFKEASKLIEEEEIDAIISSSWPITCHTIAKDLNEKYNIPWIADLRDLWNLNPYVSHTFIRNYFEKRLELKTFENADALSTTTDLAAKTLSTLHPDNRIVPILSGYDKDDFKFLDELVSKNDDFSSDFSEKLKFIYAGSLYSGKRDPSYLFEAIRQLEDENKLDSSKISIEFYGDSYSPLDILG